jgi:hypothetical protein
MFRKVKIVHTVLLISLIMFSTFFVFPTITPVQAQGSAAAMLPDFEEFVASVSNGQSGVARGVYVPGLFASSVVPQPGNNPGYVSPISGTVTEFGLARRYGNIGLLAHNYLTGASFSKLSPGQEIRLVYGNGDVAYYVVEEVLRYQALEPNNAESDFIDLNTGKRISATTLFKRVYTGQQHVTFQTCIYADGINSWGRLFVLAVPITEMQKMKNFMDDEIRDIAF